jgi:hypothetical protein
MKILIGIGLFIGPMLVIYGISRYSMALGFIAAGLIVTIPCVFLARGVE